MIALNRIVAKKSTVNVLRVLRQADSALSGRQIQRRSGLSNRATMLALEDLTSASIVDCEPSGRSYFYTLNTDNFFWQTGLKTLLEAEDAFWKDLPKTVKGCVDPAPAAVIVTGSLAREEPTNELELHLIFGSGRDRLKAYKHNDALKEVINHRYGLELHPTYMDKKTMDNPEYESLWERIANEGVLIFGELPS